MPIEITSDEHMKSNANSHCLAIPNISTDTSIYDTLCF